MLVSQKKQISNIIEEFKSILPIFDPMGQQSQQLRSLISQTGEIGSSSYSLKELDGIYKRVTEFYSHIILQIPDIIDNQIKTLSQVSNPCAKALLQSSISVKQQKSFQLLKNQALENFKWLSQYHQLKESLHQDCQKLKDCSQVEGVNKGLHNRIDIILNTLIGTGDITLCQEKYQHISTQIEAIDKPESRQRISKYLHCLKEYFDQKSQVSIIYRPILEYIQQSIEASQDDNFQLLRQLAYIEYQIDILSQMDHIKDLCQQEPLDSYAKSIQTKINDLYRSLNSQDRDIISKVLNIDNPQAQAPQVLVLLLADKKIKSSKLPVILGVYSNLNAVKSRLLAELKSKAAFLEDYQRDQGKSSVVLIHLLSILA